MTVEHVVDSSGSELLVADVIWEQPPTARELARIHTTDHNRTVVS